MVRDTNGIGDDGQGWVDGACRDETGSVDNIKIVQVVGLTVRIENARQRVCPHSASPILVAYAFDRNAFFEIGVERNGRCGMAGSFENVDPPVFEPLEALHIIGSVGKLNAIWSVIGNIFGLIHMAGISRGMRAAKPWLAVLDGERRSVVQRYSVVLVGQILS